jgi:hypothetical protein
MRWAWQTRGCGAASAAYPIGALKKAAAKWQVHGHSAISKGVPPQAGANDGGLGPRVPSVPLTPPQALQLHDVGVRDRTLGVLMAYHPFWLKLGLEVVTQRAVGGGASGRGEQGRCRQRQVDASPGQAANGRVPGLSCALPCLACPCP